MKDLFFTNFSIEAEQFIAVSGAGNNAALIHLLAEEATATGLYSLVTASAEQRYPIEGKVLISDETDLLFRLIRSDEPEVTYLASKVEGDLLIPFAKKELQTLIQKSDTDTKIFVNLHPENKAPAFFTSMFKKALHICTVNFNVLRPQLLEIYQNTEVRSSSTAQKKIQKQFLALIEQTCPSCLTIKDKGRCILFIDQIKNVLDENLFIPVARHFQKTEEVTILYGNLHQYSVKKI